ncbi:DUF5666 domain-containing protein [Frankia gtarii]|uniref:DUF5666 domain-containing protein n=1 Tax=Frankia gtarii TaxID=2950102 RepID=UPI0021C0D844|nr:DUF5666 domain-containing protein [Frankia gtarii]
MTTANPVDPSRSSESPLHRRALAAGPILGAAVAMIVTVSACGSGSSGGSMAAAAAASTPSQAAGFGQGQGARPGTIGTIAAVTATNVEVQNPASGQVTVTWAPSTTFVRTTTADASAVAVGDCVTVTGGSPGSTFTAQTVTVSQPVSGSCTAGFGRGFGGAGGFPGGVRPSGAPTARPPDRSTVRPNGQGRLNGQGRPNGGRFAVVTGSVTKMAGTTITVQGPQRPGAGASASAAPAATASPGTTVTSTVTLGSSTTVEKTSSATSAALAVGECLTATGKADDTGAVSATSISVRPAGKQGCTGGFGGRGFGGQGSGRQDSGGGMANG